MHASEIFTADDCSLMLETQDYPRLRLDQDGDSTPVSDLMGRENHIFTAVPRAEMEAELDWRLPVFEAGQYLIAVEGLPAALGSAQAGAASLLLELWKKTKEATRAM